MDKSTQEKKVSILKMEVPSERMIQRNRRWHIAQGILFLILGVIAFVAPTVTVMGIQTVLALLLIISGAYQGYLGFLGRTGGLMFSGALSLSLGIFMLSMPWVGAIAVATIIATFLFIEGVIEIYLARQMRFSDHWSWLMVAGILSVALSIVLLVGWPERTLFLVGLFLGVNFMLYGISIIAVVASVSKKSSMG